MNANIGFWLNGVSTVDTTLITIQVSRVNVTL